MENTNSQKLESKLVDTLKYDIAPHLALNAATLSTGSIPIILGGLLVTSSYYKNSHETPSRALNTICSLGLGVIVAFSSTTILTLFSPNSQFISRDFKIGSVESREILQHSKIKLTSHLNSIPEIIESGNLYQSKIVDRIETSPIIRTKFETGYCGMDTRVLNGTNSVFNLDNKFSVQDGSKTSTQYSNSLFGSNNSVGTLFQNTLLTDQQRSDAILCRDFVTRNSKKLKGLKKVFPKHMEPLK